MSRFLSLFPLILCLCIIAKLNVVEARLENERSSRSTVISLIYFNNTNTFSFAATNRTGASCRWLRNFKHEGKFCRKKKGLSEVLLNAKQLALEHCKIQFRYDRWNCSYKKAFFKKVFRETAFMQSLATAAMMYSIARACSDGKLQNCKCPVYEKVPNRSRNWTWGGCGDNIKGARRITNKFLQLRQKGDYFKQILNYNAQVGINTIADNEMVVCTCHGLSASCTMKTCWKRIKPFGDVAENLKNLYHTAIRLTSTENKANVQNILKRKRAKTLYYTSQSPNFCPTTVGRRCKDVGNCETLCCGRGHYQSTIVEKRKCQCRWQNTTYPSIKCNLCDEEEDIFTCK